MGTEKEKMELEERTRKKEEERLAVEREFLEVHKRERRLSKAGGFGESSSQVDSKSETDRRKNRVGSKGSCYDQFASFRRWENGEVEED